VLLEVSLSLSVGLADQILDVFIDRVQRELVDLGLEDGLLEILLLLLLVLKQSGEVILVETLGQSGGSDVGLLDKVLFLLSLFLDSMRQLSKRGRSLVKVGLVNLKAHLLLGLGLLLKRHGSFQRGFGSLLDTLLHEVLSSLLSLL